MTGSWTIQIWWIIRGVSHFDFGEVPMVLVLGHNHTAFISHILDTSRMRCQNSRRWRLCLPLTWWRARWLPQRGRFSKTRLGVPERLPWFIWAEPKQFHRILLCHNLLPFQTHIKFGFSSGDCLGITYQLVPLSNASVQTHHTPVAKYIPKNVLSDFEIWWIIYTSLLLVCVWEPPLFWSGK